MIEKKTAAIIASLILGASLFSLGFYTFDKQFHINTAEHYSEDWTSLTNWESSVGLDLSSYSPLAHHVAAAFSYIIGTETAVNILFIIFWVLLAYNATEFFREYFGFKRFWTVYLLIFFQIGVMKKVLVYGMFTSVAGFAAGFFALRVLYKAIERNRKTDWVLFTFSYSIIGYLTTFSFILFTVAIPGFLLIESSKIDRKRLKYAALSYIGVFLLITVGLNELVSHLFYGTGFSEQVIPHPSWAAWTELNQRGRELWIWSSLSFSLIGFLLPAFYRKLKEDGILRKSVGIYGLGVFIMLIDITGVDGLPRILFPGVRNVMNFGRFTIMGGIILTFFTAYILEQAVSMIDREKLGKSVRVAVVIFLILLNTAYIFRVHSLYHPGGIRARNSQRPEMEEFVIEFLEDYGNRSYRFQTLGFGYRVTKLIAKTDVPMSDGEFYQGVPLEWIRDFEQQGVDVSSPENAKEFIRRAPEINVKYIIAFNRFNQTDFSKIMEETAGEEWKKVRKEEFGPFYGTAWINTETEPIKETPVKRSYLQTTIPITVLILFISTIIFRWKYPEKTVEKAFQS